TDARARRTRRPRRARLRLLGEPAIRLSDPPDRTAKLLSEPLPRGLAPGPRPDEPFAHAAPHEPQIALPDGARLALAATEVVGPLGRCGKRDEAVERASGLESLDQRHDRLRVAPPSGAKVLEVLGA